MSAERERSSSRALESRSATSALGRILAALLITMPLVTAVPAMSGSAIAATGSPGSIVATAAPAANGVVRAGQQVSVRVTVSNVGSATSPALSVALLLEAVRSADPSRLSAWFAGDDLDTELPTVAMAEVGPLDPGSSAVLDLAVASQSAGLSGSLGARLASIVVTAGAEELAVDRTAIVWVPDGSATDPVSTAFLLPISTPGDSGAFIDASTLERATAPAGSLTRTLDAVAGRAVVLAIDPRLIASIRLLGDSAPPSATAFLSRLALVPNETFLLPWADADPVATVDASGFPLPQPEGAGVPLDAALGTDATPDPEPSGDPQRSTTLAELGDWPTTFDGLSWPEQGTLTSAAATVLAEQGSASILAPDDAVSGTGLRRSTDDADLIVFDAALSNAARDAVRSTSQQQFDSHMARVSALLAARGPSADPALITLGRERIVGTMRLGELIAQVIGLPWTQAGELSAMLAGTGIDAGVTIRDAEPDPVRIGQVTAALIAEEADRDFAQIANEPEIITDRRRLELLAALSLGWGDSADGALRNFISASTALRGSVQITESSSILLLTDRASLPVTVRNDLDVAVEVFVRVDPDSGQLRVLDSRVPTLVEPRSQARALVPVESLTNGEVDITVTIRTADGQTIGDPTRVSLNLQAGWETAGTVAFALVIVLLFTVGLVRDIRRRKRRVAGSTADGDGGAS